MKSLFFFFWLSVVLTCCDSLSPLPGTTTATTEINLVSSQAYARLDVCLARETDRSRAAWASAIKDGCVFVDGVVANAKSSPVEEGAVIEACYATEDSSVFPEPSLEIEVLFEDDDLVVVNKAAGMVTHPAPGHPRGTLANALAGRYGSGSLRAGIVHRLDKGTSGVMVAAKNEAAQDFLSRAFRERTVDKLYLAVCKGVLPEGEMVVDEPIARDPVRRDRMAVVSNGRRAVSRVRRLATDGTKMSIAQVGIETGRTHQIRVHLQHLKYPVAGDDAYGDAAFNERVVSKPPFSASRPLLHAWQLEFPSPSSPGKRLKFIAPPPEDMRRAVGQVSGLSPPP